MCRCLPYLCSTHVAQVAGQRCAEQKDHQSQVSRLSGRGQLGQSLLKQLIVVVGRAWVVLPLVFALEAVENGGCFGPLLIVGGGREQMGVVSLWVP